MCPPASTLSPPRTSCLRTHYVTRNTLSAEIFIHMQIPEIRILPKTEHFNECNKLFNEEINAITGVENDKATNAYNLMIAIPLHDMFFYDDLQFHY